MTPTAQFSPQQVLDAGRRAENDGRAGYAIQLYRYLTDNHPRSPEAAIAKEALTRLANHCRPPEAAGIVDGPGGFAGGGYLQDGRDTQQQYSPPYVPPTAGRSANGNTTGQAAATLAGPGTTAGPLPTPQAYSQPALAQQTQPSLQTVVVPQWPQVGPPGSQTVPIQPPVAPLAPQSGSQSIRQPVAPQKFPEPFPQQAAYSQHAQAAAVAQAAAPLHLPPPKRGYRLGRVVASLLSMTGWVMVLAGLAMLGSALMGFKLPGKLGLALAFSGGLPGAAVTLSLGLFQIMAGQLGRAVFDGANAVRDLAMIERAKVVHLHGAPTDDENEPD